MSKYIWVSLDVHLDSITARRSFPANRVTPQVCKQAAPGHHGPIHATVLHTLAALFSTLDSLWITTK
jgi:hypothetical protein